MEKQNSELHMYSQGNVEYRNPSVHFCQLHMTSSMRIDNLRLENKMPFSVLIHNALVKRAKLSWLKYLSELSKIELPKGLTIILENLKKNVQKQALKNVVMTPDILQKWACEGWDRHGYVYSRYRYDIANAGDEDHLFPEVMFLEGDKVQKAGSTTMTEGQMKHAINYMNVHIAHFLDNKEGWHCFFITYKSMKGMERHAGGKPHLHYISDKWNIPREEVLNQLASKVYSLPSLPHVEYYRED